MGKSYLASTINRWNRLRDQGLDCEIQCFNRARYVQTVRRVPYTEEDKRNMQAEQFTVRVCNKHNYQIYKNGVILGVKTI